MRAAGCAPACALSGRATGLANFLQVLVFLAVLGARSDSLAWSLFALLMLIGLAVLALLLVLRCGERDRKRQYMRERLASLASVTRDRDAASNSVALVSIDVWRQMCWQAAMCAGSRF